MNWEWTSWHLYSFFLQSCCPLVECGDQMTQMRLTLNYSTMIALSSSAEDQLQQFPSAVSECTDDAQEKFYNRLWGDSDSCSNVHGARLLSVCCNALCIHRVWKGEENQGRNENDGNERGSFLVRIISTRPVPPSVKYGQSICWGLVEYLSRVRQVFIECWVTLDGQSTTFGEHSTDTWWTFNTRWDWWCSKTFIAIVLWLGYTCTELNYSNYYCSILNRVIINM